MKVLPTMIPTCTSTRSFAPVVARGLLATAAFAILALASTSATAQWVWKDESGHTIASDQPPPVGVPASRILKSPRTRAAATPAATPSDDAAKPAGSPTAPDAPKSLADRELESKQRQKDAADAEKKAGDEATRAKAMQDNCRQVRSNVAALQAGGRAARFNEKGERVYLDDSQRQAEINRQQGQVSQYCTQ